jgi:outer membrane protein TolC
MRMMLVIEQRTDATRSNASKPRRVRMGRWLAASAFGLGVTVYGGGAWSQATPQTVTLGAALQQALRPDNPTLQKQNDAVGIAAGKAQEASGAFDWTANAQGGWQQLYVPTPENGFLTDRTDITSSYYYSANIGRKFRNGIEIAPGITAYPGAGATPAQTSGLTQIRPALGLKIPLLRGAGTQNADAPERSAFASLDSARENRAFAVQQFTQNVAATFWRCVADDKIVESDQAADRQSADYGDTLKDLLNKGLLEPTIVQQWSANTAAQRLAVARAQDESQRCRRDLAYALTGNVQQPWSQPAGDLPNIDDLKPAIDRMSEQGLITLALDQRQDLKAANHTVLAAQENLRTAKDNTRSQFDLHIDPDHAIASFTKSLGNNVAKGRVAQASSAEDQTNLALQQLEDQVRNQVSDSVTDLKRTASDWTALDSAEKQMETVVGDAEKRARFGSIAWTDYQTAQNQLYQLRQQVINVRLAFAIAVATLRLATGTIDIDHPSNLATDLVKLPILTP